MISRIFLQVGDGTTSVTVLASELIREAEKLVDMRLHPQTIIAGWRKAAKVAREALEAQALDHGKDPEKFREDLMNIARTTLSSKILSQHKDFFSKMTVDAILRLKSSGNLDAIQITRVPGGTLENSFLDEGGFYIFVDFCFCKSFTSFFLCRIPPQQSPRKPPAQEDRERQDTHRQHPHGHGQDQGVWLPRPRGKRG